MKATICCAAVLCLLLACVQPARAACWYDAGGHFTEMNYQYDYPAGDARHVFVYASGSGVASDCPAFIPPAFAIKGKRMSLFQGQVSVESAGSRLIAVKVTDTRYNQGTMRVPAQQRAACGAAHYKTETMLAYAGMNGTLVGWQEADGFCMSGFVQDTVPLLEGGGTRPEGFTCWFDAGGRYTGADDADSRFPKGQVTRDGKGGYGYTFGGPSTGCPRQLPERFYVQPPVYLLHGKLTTMENRRTEETVYLMHDEEGDSDYVLSKCAPNRFDPKAMSGAVGRTVWLTGVYRGGEFCVTGFVGP